MQLIWGKVEQGLSNRRVNGRARCTAAKNKSGPKAAFARK
jgi:hypothetical protein